jgi:hypothetical protein
LPRYRRRYALQPYAYGPRDAALDGFSYRYVPGFVFICLLGDLVYHDGKLKLGLVSLALCLCHVGYSVCDENSSRNYQKDRERKRPLVVLDCADIAECGDPTNLRSFGDHKEHLVREPGGSYFV